MNHLARLGLLTGALALAGCTSISGLGGGSGYACKPPAGVTCDSVSGVYAKAQADRSPGRRGPEAPLGAIQTAPLAPSPPPSPSPSPALPPRVAMFALPVPAQAPPVSSLRSSARVLRLWVKPWEDADGDLIDQSYVYVQVDAGQWLIEHAQRQIREAYAPVRPPARGTNPARAVGNSAAEPGPARPSPAGRAAPAPAPAPADNLD